MECQRQVFHDGMLGDINEDRISKEATKEQRINGVKTNDDRWYCQQNEWNCHDQRRLVGLFTWCQTMMRMIVMAMIVVCMVAMVCMPKTLFAVEDIEIQAEGI